MRTVPEAIQVDDTCTKVLPLILRDWELPPGVSIFANGAYRMSPTIAITSYSILSSCLRLVAQRIAARKQELGCRLIQNDLAGPNQGVVPTKITAFSKYRNLHGLEVVRSSIEVHEQILRGPLLNGV